VTYETRIAGRFVEVTSARTGKTYRYEIPPGMDPKVFALRCADRARVDECLAAI
jgi:hypothetical protein